MHYRHYHFYGQRKEAQRVFVFHSTLRHARTMRLKGKMRIVSGTSGGDATKLRKPAMRAGRVRDAREAS